MARADRQQLRTHQAAGQARRDRRSQRPRARLQRRRRHDRRRPVGNRRSRRRRARRSAPRSTTARPSGAQTWPKQPAPQRSRSPTSRGRCRPTRRAASRRWSCRASASSRRAGATTRTSELAAHVLGYVGLDNVGLGGLESAYDAQIRGKDGKMLMQTDARRHAFEPRRAAADRRRRHRADDRRVPAAHRRARAARRRRGEPRGRRHARSSWIRTPARSSRWRTGRRSIPNAFTRVRRRRRAATARSRTSTSRARRSRSSPRRPRSKKNVDHARRRSIDDQPGLHHVRAASRSTTRTTTALISFTDVIVEVEQRRRDQGRAARSAPSALGRLRQPLRLRPDARAGLPRRERGHRLESGAARRERARVGVDGLPGRRHAAADGDARSARSPTAASCSSRASCARSSRTAAAIDVPHKVRAPDDHRRTPRRR